MKRFSPSPGTVYPALAIPTMDGIGVMMFPDAGTRDEARRRFAEEEDDGSQPCEAMLTADGAVQVRFDDGVLMPPVYG